MGNKSRFLFHTINSYYGLIKVHVKKKRGNLDQNKRAYGTRCCLERCEVRDCIEAVVTPKTAELFCGPNPSWTGLRNRIISGSEVIFANL